MSLHHASKYLASKGRGEDTMLVHMTPREVKGLQELALAHGGSLTINPETGLPEAGILKSILPMVAGAALTVATGGTALAAYAPLMAAAMAGGGMYAATGSVKEGLLAGLGAYGGAGLASSAMAAGAEAATSEAVAAETSRQAGLEATNKAVAEGAGQAVGEESTRQMGLNAAQQAAQDTAKMDEMARQGMTFNQQANALGGAAQTGAPVNPQLQGADAFKNLPGNQYADIVQQGTSSGMTTQQINNSLGLANASQTGANMSGWDQFGKGLTNPSAIGSAIAENPKPLMAAGISMLNGAQSSAGAPQQTQEQSNPFGLATLSPNFKGYNPPQPDPYYQAQYTDYSKKRSAGLPGYSGYAEGGIVGLAAGGDPMAPMQNTVYPQSQQDHTQFATPTQYPNSMKMAMASDYDTRTNPQNGEESPIGLAAGGVARYADGGMSLSDLGQLLSGQNNPNILAQYAGAKLTGQLGNNAAGTATAPTGPVSPGYVGFEGDTIGDGITPSNPFMRSATTTTAISAPASQTGWGQNAQGYNSFSSGFSSSGNTGTGLATSGNNGVFPLEGQYGIVKMATGGVARYDGGGIGAIRRMQPGGKWGSMTADLYGVVDKNAPWLTDMQPGGAMGALQPGRMDYEDRKRAEEEAKQAEIDAQNADVAKKKAIQDQYNRFNQAPAGGMQQMQAFQSYASGGIASYAPGGHLPSAASIPNTGIYRDTDANTATKDAYEAALYKLQKANKMAGIKTAMPKAAMTKLGNVDADVAEAASGGIAHYSLGGYSDGGRMLKGPGDGMSDSIPASIGAKQPARLADGEFVVPADVVSHLGNGSTDAGAKKLYSMMDKVRKARTGTKKQGKQINADKFTPK